MEDKLTILEWLLSAPKQWRYRALENYYTKLTTHGADMKTIILKTQYTSLSTALDRAFGWYNTPEGGAYWSAIHDMLKETEYKQNQL